jgi:hypothetical protein
LRRHEKGIQSCLPPKPLEFEGFKIRIVKRFPQAQVFNGIAVAHPVSNDTSRVTCFVFRNVSERNVVSLVNVHDSDFRILDLDFLRLRHWGVLCWEVDGGEFRKKSESGFTRFKDFGRIYFWREMASVGAGSHARPDVCREAQ